ncbi:MAG: carbonic anhydrase [Candidatus Sigynarchaeota archaeon]
MESRLIEKHMNALYAIKDSMENPRPRVAPAERPIIITCTSPWVDPAKIFDLEPGEAYVIRIAGNITLETIRSIMLAMLTDRISDVIVLGHAGCKSADKVLVYKNLDSFTARLPLRSYLREYFSTRESALKYLGIFNDEIDNVRAQVESLAFLKRIQPGLNVSGMLYNERNGHVYTLQELDQVQKILKSNPKKKLDDFVPTRYKDFEKKREAEKKLVPMNTIEKKLENLASAEETAEKKPEKELAKQVSQDMPAVELPAEFEGQRLAFEKLMEAMQKSIAKATRVRVFTPKIRMPRIKGIGVNLETKAPPA